MSVDRLPEMINQLLPELVALRRDLHAHPELGYQEKRTSQTVQRELRDAGISFVPGLAGGTGVLAHLPGAGEAAIGLRADMDALPMCERNQLSYSSKFDSVMHACGHDGHVTMLVGAARVLGQLGALPRPVTLLFQPAEEGGGGAAKMVADGCLRGERLGPPVQRLFGLHGWPDLPLGKVATRTGPLLAAQDGFTLTVRGLGCHAAWPQVGRDPVVAGAAIVTALQQIVSRNVDPLASLVISVTCFNAGTAVNVIPEYAVLRGTVRNLDEQTRKLAEARLIQVAVDVGRAYGCEVDVDYVPGYPVTENSAEAVACFANCAQTMLGEAQVELNINPVMGAEDFSYYCREVPSCFALLGLQQPDRHNAQLHQPDFDFNDAALPIGVELLCRLALT